MTVASGHCPEHSYAPAGRDHTKCSAIRISAAEIWQIRANYALCGWNGTVYGVSQSV